MASGELIGLTTAIYARFSSDDQRDASIDDQVRRCRELIESRGGTVHADLVFVDRAMSGAGTDRPAYERMMRLATGKPRQIDVIVVEDLSRLGRAAADLFTAQRLLDFAGVRLVGLADGIDTSAPHSKLTFGLKSIIADAYLAELGDKTRRGLEGRARAGLATGGVPYGYRLTKVRDAGGNIVGSEIAVEPGEAKIIRRIFRLYLEGKSLRLIAIALNAKNVPPPRFGAKRRRRGWKDSSIRAMLHNESYIGTWSWGKRKWKKVPGTNKRRYVAAAKPIVSQRPHLRIIDAETWEAVQERLRAVSAHYTRTKDGKPKGRSLPGRPTPYLFSSLLVCGVCGGKMVVSGGSTKAYYRCEGNTRRGVCKNNLSVPEPVVRANILDELRNRLASNEGIAYARKRIAERLGELTRERDGEVREARSALDKIDRHIDKLIDFIAEGRSSNAIADKLATLEREREGMRSKLSTLEKRTATPIRIPRPDDMLRLVFDLERRLTADVSSGREELRRLFRDGTITLVPQKGGFYIARSEILPLVLLTQTPSGGTEGRYEVSRSSASSCAGRI
jgi:site-specific DNA recombinase